MMQLLGGGTSTISRNPVYMRPVLPQRRVITTWQSGHGWTAATADAATDLNATDDIALGSQSPKVVTGTTNIAATFDSPTLTAVDFTGHELLILMKITNVAALADLRVYLSTDTGFANARNINLIATEGGGSDAQYVKEGEWTWFSVHPSRGSAIGTPNMAAVTKVRIRVQAVNGAQVTARFGGLYRQRQEHTTRFPFGAASFTYDDGRASGISFGRRALDRWGWAGTAYPIRDRIGLATYATLADLHAARRLSRWEIGLHADTGSDHDAGFTNLTPSQVEADLFAERRWAYENDLGEVPGFAWPRGMSAIASEDAAARVASYGRGIYTAANTTQETLPPTNRMRLRALSIGAATSLALLTGEADKASANGGWVIYVFHDVVASGATTSLQVNQATHDGLVDYIGAMANQPAVLPVIDVMKRLSGS